MRKLPGLFLLLMLMLLSTAQAQTSVTISLSGTANATPSGANYNFTMTGSANVSGFGAAALSGAGVIDNSTLMSFGPISGTITLIFSGTDVLVATFSVPAGVLIPQIGGSSSGTGNIKIIGGTGKFTGATGSFSSVSGTGTGTGPLSTTFQITGVGLITGGSSGGSSGTPGLQVYAGSIAHIASGGGWGTTLTFENLGSSAAQFHLAIFDESGNSLPLPITFPQFPSTPLSQASTIDRTLNPGAVLVINSQGGNTLLLGTAQLSTDGSIAGSAIFRYAPSGQEAVVPLETRNPAAFVLPFDNTNGLANGLAIANISGAVASIKVIINDDSGANNLVTDTLNLPARGHISFVLTDKYAVTAQHLGTITVQTPTGGQISVLGIRAAPSGAYTSIPPGVK